MNVTIDEGYTWALQFVLIGLLCLLLRMLVIHPQSEALQVCTLTHQSPLFVRNRSSVFGVSL